MTFDDVVAKLRAQGDALMRNGEVDVDYIVQLTLEAVGFSVGEDGTIQNDAAKIQGAVGWAPPGGFMRPRRNYRNGRGPRK